MEKKEIFSKPATKDFMASGIKGDTPVLSPRIYVSQSELQFMAGLAERWGGIETGGECYGSKTHEDRPVVVLATPPGPRAIHKTAYFQQDIDFLRKTNMKLWDNCCVQYVGNHHSHHYLPKPTLSSVDIRSLHSIASRNRYKCLCQFLIKFENKIPSRLRSRDDRFYGEGPKEITMEMTTAGRATFESAAWRLKPRFRKSSQPELIRIYAFLYLDAAHDQPIRCPIHVIPGISPIRRAINRRRSTCELAQTYTFPMSRILIDSIRPEGILEHPIHGQKLSSLVYEQCLQLPLNVQDGARVTFRDDLSILSLPVPSGGMMFVVYDQNKQHGVRAVYLRKDESTDEPIDLTDVTLCHGPYTNLATIYHRGVRFIYSDNSVDCQRYH